jgi:hypothetical protein
MSTHLNLGPILIPALEPRRRRARKRSPLYALAVGIVVSLLSAACSASTDSSGANTGDEQDVKALSKCGGIAGLTCSSGKTCVDDPSDSCDPEAGGRDCGGVCINKATAKKCGGFAGVTCSTGSVCVDDPSDSCDPHTGGADCSGFCVHSSPSGGDATCATVHCSSGYHCEVKGINGGAIGVCIKGEPCGNTFCGDGEQCCNPLNGTCVLPGKVCAF